MFYNRYIIVSFISLPLLETASMNASLSHLSIGRQNEIQAITSRIVRAIHPEKILLFGLYATNTGIPDPEPGNTLLSGLSSYDILVIPRQGDKRYDYEVQDFVENSFRFVTPVTAFVHDMDYVNRQISIGQYFFILLLKEGVLLYDAGTCPLAEAPTPNWAGIRALAREDFNKTWHRAQVFFDSARFNQERHECKIAAFLLHQAAEQAYNAILLAFNGYKPCTHNLDKLRRYTLRLSLALALLFPRNTPEEDHLFKLLQEAYYDARYKDNYAITLAELEELTGRIHSMLSIAERICNNRFVGLGKMAMAS
jgi:uncharacterized protein